MRVAIVGFGMEGRSAFTYWQKRGADITICDQDTDIDVPAGAHRQLGAHYLDNLGQFDVVVRSAGLPGHLILQHNPGIEDKITTVINEFLRVCPTKNVIGITGTKGKGTTSTLTALMLEAMGKQVFLAGNIGQSPLDFLDKITPDSWVVLELSSYQLSDIRRSTHIAVCLMVVPEHLNWHHDMENYTGAKANLFAHQSPHDTAIYFADSTLSHSIASHSPGAKITYYAPPGAYVDHEAIMIDDQELCPLSDLKMLGKHNWQNACAAATVAWQVEQAPAAIRNVLTTFTGLPHRLEFVREVNGVSFYNDSFSSAPPASAAALQALPGKKVLIMGGFDRHLPLDMLVEDIVDSQDDIRTLLLIGQSRQRIADELSAAGFTNYHPSKAETMPEIVAQAAKRAQPGDTIVLSPGFPSFDMFKNFEQRGLLFKEAVHNL